jgi:hypothetical protein
MDGFGKKTVQLRSFSVDRKFSENSLSLIRLFLRIAGW